MPVCVCFKEWKPCRIFDFQHFIFCIVSTGDYLVRVVRFFTWHCDIACITELGRRRVNLTCVFNRCYVDTSDISGINQGKMSALTAERDQVKTILRGLLISSAQTMTAEQLHRDFRQQEGQNVPYRKLGYNSFLEYLKSIPDAVAVSFVYCLRSSGKL